jgi:hypothetical protein
MKPKAEFLLSPKAQTVFLGLIMCDSVPAQIFMVLHSFNHHTDFFWALLGFLAFYGRVSLVPRE